MKVMELQCSFTSMTKAIHIENGNIVNIWLFFFFPYILDTASPPGLYPSLPGLTYPPNSWLFNASSFTATRDACD